MIELEEAFSRNELKELMRDNLFGPIADLIEYYAYSVAHCRIEIQIIGKRRLSISDAKAVLLKCRDHLLDENAPVPLEVMEWGQAHGWK